MKSSWILSLLLLGSCTGLCAGSVALVLMFDGGLVADGGVLSVGVVPSDPVGNEGFNIGNATQLSVTERTSRAQSRQ